MMGDQRQVEGDLDVFEEASGSTAKQSSRPVEGEASSSNELTLGIIHSVDALGQFKVVAGGSQQPVPCMATFKVGAPDVGRQVALMFIDADVAKPVALGLIRSQLDQILELQQSSTQGEYEAESSDESSESDKQESVKQLLVDGESIKIEGKEEIVLKCGESSITLNKSGKITIRGKYLLNRSSGVNRIMGGSVQLN